jgi:hypothetical protein
LLGQFKDRAMIVSRVEGSIRRAKIEDFGSKVIGLETKWHMGK